MYGQNENKDNFEAPTYRALGGFAEFADYEPFTSGDTFKSLAENSLEPITWRSSSDGFGGGFEMGGWAGMPHEDSMNPKLDMPQLGGHKELYHGWGAHQTNQAKTIGSVFGLSATCEPPSAPGGYLEPHCHFMSTTPCALLFQTLQAWLDDTGIDFVVKPAKFTCKCVSFRNGAKQSFVIRIFSTNTQRQYAVEFNRRCGDARQFGEMYRGAKAALAEGGHVLGYQPPSHDTTPHHQLPPLDLESVGSEEVGSGLECLVAMATSGFVDMQAQALQGIADLTAERAHSPAALPANTLPMLVESLQSNSDDINRCALTCLANLVCGQLELCQQLAEQRVISTLLALTAAESTQVARESTRALANMAEIMRAPMVDYEPRLRSEVPVLAKSDDVRVRGYAAALQRIVV